MTTETQTLSAPKGLPVRDLVQVFNSLVHPEKRVRRFESREAAVKRIAKALVQTEVSEEQLKQMFDNLGAPRAEVSEKVEAPARAAESTDPEDKENETMATATATKRNSKTKTARKVRAPSKQRNPRLAADTRLTVLIKEPYREGTAGAKCFAKFVALPAAQRTREGWKESFKLNGEDVGHSAHFRYALNRKMIRIER